MLGRLNTPSGSQINCLGGVLLRSWSKRKILAKQHVASWIGSMYISNRSCTGLYVTSVCESLSWISCRTKAGLLGDLERFLDSMDLLLAALGLRLMVLCSILVWKYFMVWKYLMVWTCVSLCMFYECRTWCLKIWSWPCTSFLQTNRESWMPHRGR